MASSEESVSSLTSEEDQTDLQKLKDSMKDQFGSLLVRHFFMNGKIIECINKSSTVFASMVRGVLHDHVDANFVEERTVRIAKAEMSKWLPNGQEYNKLRRLDSCSREGTRS